MNPPRTQENVNHPPRPQSDPSLAQSPSTESSVPASAPPISEEEATQYYTGLPSRPRLLARTNTTPWEKLKPSILANGKELRIVSPNHPLHAVWPSPASDKVIAYLDERQVRWTSIDVVRIGVADPDVWPPPATVVLWIGVRPGSLGADDARTAAFGCLDLLRGFGVDEVEVELRQSIVVPLVG